MTSQKLQWFLRKAESTRSTKPPAKFLTWLGFQNEIGEFKRAAWRLFRDTKQKPTREEVRAYLKSYRLPKGGDRVVGAVESHFFDSGSFSLQMLARKWAERKGRSQWEFYDTKTFWKYMEHYSNFLKANSTGVDYYANVDVIGSPELTWRNQQWLEDQDLSPIPVVHYDTDFKWLRHYIGKEYDYIALGGLVAAPDLKAMSWCDKAFGIICNTPDRLPKVKVHGFGITSFELMRRYPWYSVDSTSWSKIAGYGNILVPVYQGGKFCFDKQPYTVPVTVDASFITKPGRHFFTYPKPQQRVILRWLDEIGIPLGESDKTGNVITWGVVNSYIERRVANLFTYERLRESIPEYPWPFRTAKRYRRGFIK